MLFIRHQWVCAFKKIFNLKQLIIVSNLISVLQFFIEFFSFLGVNRNERNPNRFPILFIINNDTL